MYESFVYSTAWKVPVVGKVLCIYPYSVRTRENEDQNNS